MENSAPSSSLLRRFAAAAWLLAALLPLPLAWGRIGGEKIPFFGSVELLTLPIVGVFALAGAVAFGDWGAYRRDSRWRLFGAAQLLILLLTAWHWFAGMIGWRGALTALCWLALPVAAAGLKAELERVLPTIFALAAAVWLVSGVTSENFTGLAGNWNWTQALLAAVLPGAMLFTGERRWLFAAAALLLVGGMIGWWYPEQLSRTLAIAVPLAAGWLVFRARVPLRRPLTVMLPLFVLLAAALLTVIFVADWNDSRFQLWKGAADLALFHGVSGCGMGQFGNAVGAFLPEKYFFTPFAASWHPHPHNELLRWLGAYGLAGGLLMVSLVFLALGRRGRNDRELAAQWAFLILMLCGQTDVVLSTVPGCLLLLVCAGIAGGRRHQPAAAVSGGRAWIASALAVFALWMAWTHFAARLDDRRGQLALLAGDVDAARSAFRASVAREDDPEVRYDLAELELLRLDAPEAAENSLKALAAARQENYRHAWRLAAIRAFRIGDMGAARDALERELRLYPYSVINAGLLAAMLERSGAPAGELAAARENLEILCRLRGVSPAQALTLTPEADDRPLKPEFAPGR